MSIKKLLQAVNSEVNGLITYDFKPMEWEDWQSTNETLDCGTGDCKAIAILKMKLLMGVLDHSKLRLAYCKAPLRQAHMVLTYNDQGTVWVLDSLEHWIKPLEDTDYQPIYEIDADGNFYHDGKPRTSRNPVVDRLLGIAN